jgi:hypothetical protein
MRRRVEELIDQGGELRPKLVTFRADHGIT